MADIGVIKQVTMAMLAVQRYSWEQGVCMQALYEIGETKTSVAMAHDAVLRQLEDGRLAVIENPVAVADPAASGEMVWRAYLMTGDASYKEAAEKMLKYLCEDAPRTDKGIICHNNVSFHEGFSNKQIWVDSVYMMPAFLACMGLLDEAVFQIKGIYDYLCDENTGLLYHIYDAEQGRYVRKKLWATGNGWALMGIGRVIEYALNTKRDDLAAELTSIQVSLLDAMIKYQLPDGRFRDVLDDEETFIDGASAMMMAAAIYRGVAGGWITETYLKMADTVYVTMDKYIDEFGIIHEVCGCPHFLSQGTSAESMAAFLMMNAWKNKVEESKMKDVVKLL